MMLTLSRKSLLGAFALMASLSAPLAFAQSTEISAQAAVPPTTAPQATASTESSTQVKPAANAASAATAPAKKSWSDVDTDKDGKLTKAEAGNVPALGKVFDQADGNADGSLTTDEYKAYVAQVKGGGKSGGK